MAGERKSADRSTKPTSVDRSYERTTAKEGSGSAQVLTSDGRTKKITNPKTQARIKNACFWLITIMHK